jgi:predicted phosphodiesterase
MTSKSVTTLLIGDPHEPFAHPDYLRFCKKQYKDHKCKRVIFTGDLYEHNAISYHESDPNGHSAGFELELAEKAVKKWYKAFPNAYLCYGNHDILPYRVAKTHGIPRHMMRDLNDIYNTPKFKWANKWIFDGVMYHHGRGSGQNAAINFAKSERMSVAMGHLHAFGACQYTASTHDLIFGLNAGCGIDIDKYAFAYGKDFPNRPTLGCGIVKSSTEAYFVPMKLGVL